MAEVVAGNEQALAALYDRYSPAVFAAAFRLLGDRQLAEEVMQEAYLALWTRADRYDPAAGSLPTWLLTITRNRSVDRHRGRARRPLAMPMSSVAGGAETDYQALERVAGGGTLVGFGQATPDPETAMDRAWLRGAVLAAIDDMPETDRQAIHLAYYEELTQTEIAERLGWPLGTVKTRTRRALARLRVMLSERLGPELGDRVLPVPMPATGQRGPRLLSAMDTTGADARWSTATEGGPARGPAGGIDGPR
jgi:RNA polymerase sigma-70 factor (ECF subfamily)